MQNYLETPSRVMDSISRLNREKRNKKGGVIKLAVRDTHPVQRLKARPNKTEGKKHLTKPTPRTIKLRSTQRKVQIALKRMSIGVLSPPGIGERLPCPLGEGLLYGFGMALRKRGLNPLLSLWTIPAGARR